MTQQNRVDPWGALHAVPNRGGLMGNRGILHNDEGKIVRKWASPTWVTCVLHFRERTSPGAFRPGHYSKLFFLDEATAFAAGHRPCGECQRARYREYAERTSRTAANGKGTFTAPVSELPFGVHVEWAGDAWLIGARKELRRWSFDGYGPAVEAPTGTISVLTPASIVKTFAQGFRPLVHPSGL